MATKKTNTEVITIAPVEKVSAEITAEWKDIPCYEGLYEASSEGDIRSKENKTTSSKSITAINELDDLDTKYARSYAEMDRLLGRYNGYTSRIVCAGRDVLYDKSGVAYRITPF